MGVSIVIGGQYGSEGKGKISYWWAKTHNVAACVRPGGPNSGHTIVTDDGQKVILRMIPSGCMASDDIVAILPAGSYINLSVLLDEIRITKRTSMNLMIDPNAVVISDYAETLEKDMKLRESISSTLSGTGGAVIQRINRESTDVLASSYQQLYEYIGDTKKYMNDLIQNGKEILLEGTQGFGLSLLHSPHYPYCTARDTTAAGFLSETGLSPFDVKNIIMVIRAFPIRVGGESGPLANEISWDKVTELSKADAQLEEYTSVTKTLRRVGFFDPEIVKRAIDANKPNVIVLNHADYFDYSMHGKREISNAQTMCIEYIQHNIKRSINYIGNGENIIIRNKAVIMEERS